MSNATEVGDEENSHGWLFSDASHWVLFYGERSKLGEIITLVTLLSDDVSINPTV